MAHRNAACPAGADNELIYMSARRQLALYKKRKLSPIEVLESQIKRTAEVNPKINAVTFFHWRGARTAAKNSENRYLRDEPLPLDGVTVAIKDQFDKIGWKITAGSKLVNTVCKSNHPLVEKLIRAGAVLHMQTTAPEFYLVPLTWSDRWGITRNPWNLEVSPGGSSGGSAAAVAAGMATLAIGSDMGGSIRIPASLCGLYGYHPPYGRNSGTISDALLINASSGPLARSFSDLVLLQNILVGPIEGAPSIRPVFRLPRRYPSIKGWKIAASLNQGWAQVDPEVRAHTQSALSVLRKAHAVVDEVDLDLRMNAADVRQAIEMALFTTSVGGELADMKGRQGMTSYGRRFVKFALGMTPKQAKEASEVTAKVHKAIEKAVFAKGYRVLICPTTTTTAIPAAFDPSSHRPRINGVRVDPYVGLMLTSIFNLLNWMPVMNVPIGYSENGVPVGVQIAARAYDESAAASVAYAMSKRAIPPFLKHQFPEFR